MPQGPCCEWESLNTSSVPPPAWFWDTALRGQNRREGESRAWGETVARWGKVCVRSGSLRPQRRQPEMRLQRHWGWQVSKASGAGRVGSHGVAEIGGLWVLVQG